MERAGAINEVVKLNLAVFARAASVHPSIPSLSFSLDCQPPHLISPAHAKKLLDQTEGMQ